MDIQGVSFQTFSQKSVQEQYVPYLLATASGNEGLLRIMLCADQRLGRSKLKTLCILAAHFSHASCLNFCSND